MLIIKINNLTNLNIGDSIEIYFIYYIYCYKYNIKLIYNDLKIKNYPIKLSNYELNNLNLNIVNKYKLYENINKNFKKFNLDNNNNLLEIKIYNKNDLLTKLILYDILSYNIYDLIKKNINLINYYKIFDYEYICINFNMLDIKKDYKSLNSYINEYNGLINKNKTNLPIIIIIYNNLKIDLNKYFNNYLLEKNNNLESFFIMLYSKYLINSKTNLDKFINLFRLIKK